MFRITNLVRAAMPAVMLAASLGIGAPVKADTLSGAGSTFIAPIMNKWADAYRTETGTAIDYQGVGSGTGINDLIAQTVDFAGSDVPMTSSEKGQTKGVTTIPDIQGSVAVGYNVPGVPAGIRLTGPIVADMFAGKITYWDDPRVTRINPGTKFPHVNVVVIHRSDGSGTTAIFTDYLSKVSKPWSDSFGRGKSVNWPVGLGGKGSPGVAGYVKTNAGAIGYFELAYAIKNVIYYAAIQNKKGNFVYPYDAETTTKAAAGEPIPASLEMSITDTSNAEGYPIAGYSYLLIPQRGSSAARKFITWVITKGQDTSYVGPLHYAPIPEAVRDRALAILAK